MMTNKLTQIVLLICLPIVWLACEDDNEAQPVTINFTNVEAGVSGAANSTEVSLTFSRAISSDGEIELTLSPEELMYGKENDFYTEPEVVDNTLTLPFTTGDDEVTFTIIAGETLNIQEDKTISFTINQSENLLVGRNTTILVTFSENFVAPSGSMSFDAGGADFTKQAFVDLSKLTQTTVDVDSWDLGFYTKPDAYYVRLNSAGKVMARKLDKNSLDEVSASDTVGFAADMTVPNYTNPSAVSWIDSSDGDLSKTAFGEISASDSDNNVFIIKTAGNDNWKKVRVVRNGEGYQIQHADISSADFETSEISKDQAYNYVYFDLENGATEVAPEKQTWDVMYSSYTSSVPAGPGTNLVVGYNDFVTINKYNTSIGMVVEADVTTYENFSTENISEVDFSTARDAQASSWRDPFAGIVYDDRFYVIKDSDDNYYKLAYTSLTSSEGERGYAQFKFEKVQ